MMKILLLRIGSFLARDLLRSLTLFFIGIFLLAYASWLSIYWLDVTKWIVYYTLLITFMTEWLFKGHWLWKRIIQLLMILGMIAFQVEYKLTLILGIDSLQDVYWLLQINVDQILPYLWFALVAWVIYILISWWMNSKAKIIFLAVVTVLLFAIVDTFSPQSLWMETALLIGSGLFILVSHHFAYLKRRHPHSWEHLMEYPGSVFVPILLLITLIMSAGIIAPDVRPMMLDPYSAWKHWQGEEAVTLGQSQGRISAGAASSGYSRSDDQLGEGFQFNFQSVMEITTNQRSYWRGESRSHYTGSGWILTDLEQFSPQRPINTGMHLDTFSWFDTSLLETVEVVQRVRMVTEESFPVLFSAYHPEQISSMVMADNAHSIFDWAPVTSEIRVDERASGYPQEYTIISQIPVIDEENLRLTTEQSGDLTQDIWQYYLQLPETLPQRVIDLAEQVAGGIPNQYDQAKAIEQYLKNNYTYTNQPDLSRGQSEDFVDRFLFEIEEGYCDYYSTAMVIMVRSLGIPARWVKGYSYGALSDEGAYNFYRQNQNASIEYTVRNADAHSWVEVYFEGWGWIPFEPTAGFIMPMVELQDDEIVTPSINEPSTPAITSPDESELAIHYWVIATIVATLLILAIAAILIWQRNALLFYWRRRRAGKPQFTKNQVVIAEFEGLLDYARRKGFMSYEYETVNEMMLRWMRKNEWMRIDLEVLINIFEKAKYSGLNLTEDEVKLAIRKVKLLREEM